MMFYAYEKCALMSLRDEELNILWFIQNPFIGHGVLEKSCGKCVLLIVYIVRYSSISRILWFCMFVSDSQIIVYAPEGTWKAWQHVIQQDGVSPILSISHSFRDG